MWEVWLSFWQWNSLLGFPLLHDNGWGKEIHSGPQYFEGILPYAGCYKGSAGYISGTEYSKGHKLVKSQYYIQ